MAKTRVAPDPNLGRNIAALMERSTDLQSQPALARRTGIAQSTIGRILRAESNAGSGNVAAIAKAFGVDVGTLYLDHAAFLAAMQGNQRQAGAGEALTVYAVRNVRPVFVCGTCQGGLPETIHEGWLVETAQEYAEVASTDPKAFLCEVVGDSMVPRYMPREYALVEPSTDPEIEDDVLVRLADGSTMLKRLLGRRSGWRFGSYNSPEVLSFREDEVTWVAYVAHPVPARKIKQRSDLMPKAYAGPERRKEAHEVPLERRATASYFDTEGKDYPRDPETAARLRKLAG